MILLLVTYIGLGVYADFQHLYFLSVFCYITPLLGGNGMLTAFIAGILFLIAGKYIAGLIAIGFIIFQLILHKYWK